MPVSLHDIAIFLAPALTAFLLGGLSWAKRSVEHRIDANRNLIISEVKGLRVDFKALATDVTKHAALLELHGERLAHLECRAGEPLGSRALPRT